MSELSADQRGIVFPDELLAYKTSIFPHAQNARAARIALQPFQILDEEYQTALEIRSTATDDEISIVNTLIEEIESGKEQLGGELVRRTLTETFRQEVNELILAANRWRAQRKIDDREIHPLAASLNNRTQFPTIIPSRREPASPPFLHHGLGTLPTQRGFRLSDEINAQITTEVSRRWPANPESKTVAIAVAHLMPENTMVTRANRPSDFKKSDEVTRGIVDVTSLIIDFYEGRLQAPSAREIGLPSAEQGRHIESAIRIILINELYQELIDSYQNEDKYRQRIQTNISRLINQAAELIGHDGYDRVAAAIESLSDVEAAMLRSRLSISLDIKLGFPASQLAHEKRFAEMLNWAVYSHRGRGEVAQSQRRYAVNLILEKLGERVANGDIDLAEIFEDLESAEYGENSIQVLIEDANDENRALLYETLEESGTFRGALRKLRKDAESYPDQLVEELLDMIDQQVASQA